MKKYFMIFSLLAFVACNNSKTEEKNAIEASNREKMIQQRIIDSMRIVNLEAKQQEAKQNNVNAFTKSNNSGSKSEKIASKKRMNNKTKGALIGGGVGIVAGAATGAAVSKNKGKGAVVGGVIGGAVGPGVGYGIGSQKDKKK